MKHLKPLARLVYTSAFFVPFLWAAMADAGPLQDYEPVIEVSTAADIVALADLDGDPNMFTAEELEMIAVLHQVFGVPLESDFSTLTHRAGLIPQASGGL